MSFGSLFGLGDRYGRDPYYEERLREERRRQARAEAYKQELLRQRIQEEEEQRRRILLARQRAAAQREQEQDNLLARRRALLERQQRLEAIQRQWQPVRDWTGRVLYRNVYTGELRARLPGAADIDLSDEPDNRDVDMTDRNEDDDEEEEEEEKEEQQKVVPPTRPATRSSAHIPINTARRTSPPPQQQQQAQPQATRPTTPPRPTSPPRATTPPRPRTPLQPEAAAVRIQRRVRGMRARKAFPLKSLLAIARGERATEALIAEHHPQMEAGTLARTPAAVYEQALNKQISAMDAVLSHGNENVHARRKALIQRIERELEFIDEYFQQLKATPPVTTPNRASPVAEMVDATPEPTSTTTTAASAAAAEESQPAAEPMDTTTTATSEATATEEAPAEVEPEPMDASHSYSDADEAEEAVAAPEPMTLKARQVGSKRRRNRRFREQLRELH